MKILLSCLLLLLGSMGFALGQDETTAVVTMTTAIQHTIEDASTLPATSRPTIRPTTHAPGTPTTGGAIITPRYEVKNAGGETCILMQFVFSMVIQFTADEQQDETEVTYVSLGESAPTGNCTGSVRVFQLDFTAHKEWQIKMEFEQYGDQGKQMFRLKQTIVQWRYETPFFPENVDKKGESESVVLNEGQLDIRATAGNTFKCNSRNGSYNPLTFKMQNLMIQPYAEESKDKGDFGDLEDCSKPEPPLPSPNPTVTKAPGASISPGGIAGIVIGVLAAVVIVVGGIFYYRNRKRSSYAGI